MKNVEEKKAIINYSLENIYEICIVKINKISSFYFNFYFKLNKKKIYKFILNFRMPKGHML